METPFLDQLIEEHQNHIESVEVSTYAGIQETRKQLAELEAIKLMNEAQQRLLESLHIMNSMLENNTDEFKEIHEKIMKDFVKQFEA